MEGNYNKQSLLDAVEDFARFMEEKQYTSMFQTNRGFNGKLKDSILDYLEASALGKENNITNGFSLASYLQWNGEESDKVDVYLKAAYKDGAIHIASMVATLSDRYGHTLNKKELTGLTRESFPSRKQVIDAVMTPPPKLQMKRKKGIKF